MSRPLTLRQIDAGADRWSDRRLEEWCDDDDHDDTPDEDTADIEPDGEPDEPELDEELCFGGMR